MTAVSPTGAPSAVTGAVSVPHVGSVDGAGTGAPGTHAASARTGRRARKIRMTTDSGEVDFADDRAARCYLRPRRGFRTSVSRRGRLSLNGASDRRTQAV